MITEEHVTRALATSLARAGWRIVATHPPGGQGPFVIPRSPLEKDIERASYHPDVAAVGGPGGNSVLLAESKVALADLASDRLKLCELASNRLALLFAFFRCQQFPGGPADGVDFDSLSAVATADLPIRFVVACAGPEDAVEPDEPIEGFTCTRYVFSRKTLLDITWG